MIQLYYLLIVVLLSTQCVYAQARRDGVLTLPKGGYSFSFEYLMRATRSTFDTNGEEVSLQDGEQYQLNDFDVVARYGYSRNLQFNFGVRMRQISSTQLGPSDSQLHDLSVNQVHSGMLGISYSFDRTSNWLWALDLSYRQFNYTNPVYNPSAPNDFIAYGNDGRELMAGLKLGYRPKNELNYISGSAYYRQPGTNVSDEILYNIEAALVWKYFAIYAGLEGVHSLGNDPYGEDDTSRPILPNGPSQYFDGINRTYLSPYIGAGLGLGENWLVDARVSQTMSGKNTDKFQAILIGLTYGKRNPSGVRPQESSFKTYSLEADITKISPKGNYVVIGAGLSAGVSVGMRFDIYADNLLGDNKLVAVGQVIKIGASTAILKLIQIYDPKIKEGYVARASL